MGWTQRTTAKPTYKKESKEELLPFLILRHYTIIMIKTVIKKNHTNRPKEQNRELRLLNMLELNID